MVTALHRLISQCLVNGPKTVQQLYKILPQEKRLSIRAVCTLHPNKFLRIRRGFIGLRGRDEHLAKYQELFEELSGRPTIEFVIKCFLVNGKVEDLKKEFSMIKEKWLNQFSV
jgi:hypothetical protein